MIQYKFYYLLTFCIIIFLSACTKDLEVEPIDPNSLTPNVVYESEAGYKQVLSKIYGSFTLSNQGGDSESDIQGIDSNFGNYLRLLFNVQELPTDEAVVAWDDATIKDFHWHTWTQNDGFIAAMYARLFYTISLTNEFIRATQSGIEANVDYKETLELYEVEARFVRAFVYWQAIDLFGNVTFVTEEDEPGKFYPPQIERTDLFEYVETEILNIVSKMTAPGAASYGRVDKVAAWMLLAKLYLNAEIYTGENRYTDALTYINKVIDSNAYPIDTNYNQIFAADNYNSTEIIFPWIHDGLNIQGYGGLSFLLHASNGGGMPANGIDGGWWGYRAVKESIENFGIVESDFDDTYDLIFPSDERAHLFFDSANNGWSWEVDNVGNFTDGIGVLKYSNLNLDGSAASDVAYVDVDFPAFRTSDAYLMYAEAVLRGGSGGDMATAISYVNDLRERVNASTVSSIDLDFILAERGRELFWECQRRTDLIRFGQFTNGTYHWTWKGNIQEGQATESWRDLYPIPSADLLANPNLEQNNGYNE